MYYGDIVKLDSSFLFNNVIFTQHSSNLISVLKKVSLTWHLTSVYSPKSVLNYIFCLFVCWLWIYRPNREFFYHIESTHYWRRAANYLTMLGTHDHWALRVLYRATHTVTSVYNGLDGGCACWPYHVICSWWWDD